MKLLPLSGMVLLFFASFTCASVILHIDQPQELKGLFPNGIVCNLSPIGFKPLSGTLYGMITFSAPLSGCQILENSHLEAEPIFSLVDDTICMESVKARNLVNAGSSLGLIKHNINTTLHDKQNNIVRIPFLELAPQVFESLKQFIEAHADSVISSTVDFGQANRKLINFEVWFSPTQPEPYAFLLNMQEFFQSQSQVIGFAPHYVLQSQKQQLQVRNYIGCWSSGRYCPSEIEYEGKDIGVNILQETLRQIIIWDLSPAKWWSYIRQYSQSCLPKDIFQSKYILHECTELAMILSGVDMAAYQKQFQQSFLGSKKQFDDNTYLREERQLYVREQINGKPIGLLNGKIVTLNTQQLKMKMCRMQSQNLSDACQAFAGDSVGLFQIFVGGLAMATIMIGIMVGYKFYVGWTMKNEIKTEVDKTLEQYYRYMETFEGEQGGVIGKRKPAQIQLQQRQ